MNRNYKVIWNRSLGCFTAVAEYAKSRGKSSKSSVSSNATINTTSNLSSTRIFRTTTIFLGLIAAGFSMQATAACNISTSVRCGNNAAASPSYGVAIGENSTAQGTQAIAIGGGLSGQPTIASGEQSIAIGANVVSSGNSSIAIGGDDLSDVANIAGVNDIFIGYTGKNLIENPATPYDGHTQSLGAASVAIGVKAQSEGALSTAVGVRSSSTGAASSAFGMGASASKKGSVALGAGSTTDGNATFQEKLTIGGKDYDYAGATKDLGAQVSVGSEGKERQIKHVAAGAVNKESTDAVNGSQLNATNQYIMEMERDVGNSVSELGYNMGRSIDDLGYRIGEVEDDANAGISAAMAMSSLPQAYIIGKSMISGGIANYNGESAVALGFSKLSDDGRWVMKLNGTADTQGNVGAAIGAGFHFN